MNEAQFTLVAEGQLRLLGAIDYDNVPSLAAQFDSYLDTEYNCMHDKAQKVQIWMQIVRKIFGKKRSLHQPVNEHFSRKFSGQDAPKNVSEKRVSAANIFDARSAPEGRSANEVSAESNVGFLLDMSQVTHINSAGMALLISCFRKAKEKGIQLQFCSVPTQLARIAALTRVDKILNLTQENI